MQPQEKQQYVNSVAAACASGPPPATRPPAPHTVQDVADIQIANRPARPGSKGTLVNITTNFFKVKPPQAHIQHHDVRVDPLRYDVETGTLSVETDLKKPLPPSVIKDCLAALTRAVKWNCYWAYDGGNNIYATACLTDKQLLNRDGYQCHQVELPPREGKKHPRRMQLRIKLVQTVTMADLQAYFQGRQMEWPTTPLQALEIVLNHPFIMDPGMLYISRTFFAARQLGSSMDRDVGSGGEWWMGYKQDLRPCQLGLLLTIEPSFSIFYAGRPVLDYAAAVLAGDADRYKWQNALSPKEVKTVQEQLKGLTVEGTYGPPGKKRTTALRVSGISKEGANNYKFEYMDKESGQPRTMTVAQYFQNVVGQRLQYPAMQCVLSRRSDKRTIAVPMELLTVKEGQKRRGLLIGDQAANLVRKAAQRPEQKQRDIAGWMQTAMPRWTAAQNGARGFGLEIDGRPVTVQGRVLPPPVLQYAQPKHYFAGTKGAWNMRDFKMLEPRGIRSYIVLVFAHAGDYGGTAPGSLGNWISALTGSFRAMGIQIPDRPLAVRFPGDQGRDPVYAEVEGHVEGALTALGSTVPDVAFCILPRKDAKMYKHIKGAFDSTYGVISQCIVASKASGLGRAGSATSPNSLMQYVANVGLKVNHKLGGRNLTIHGLGDGTPVPGAPPIWGGKPTMLIGIDVSHPQSFDRAEPSIVGIVASMDRTFGQYACRIKRLGHRQEVVEGMKDEIKDLLRVFEQRNRVKPEAIVVYRDGVSQGEWKSVLAKEYTAIRKAGAELGDPAAGYSPPITYITVLKRHKARLFPGDPACDDGKGNVLPGTCVDAGITLAQGFDFYLVSHAGIQGTVKAAHYHVLHDENNFSADAVQIATHWLSYTFCRCTRSVSYCAPAYYAHLVADRGRLLLDRESIREDSSAVQSGSASASAATGAGPVLYEINEALKNRMFFV